ncbi:MAG: hypothetical protein RR705_10050 [Lachnospiraceae bacterium]
MKIYELLAIHRKFFASMTRQGVSPEDIMYIDMFKEYQTMKTENVNKSDIYRFLSQKHKVSTSAVKVAIKRLEQEYEL